jgi:dUTP pyrophosphatase
MRKFEYVNRILSTGYEMKEPEFDLPKRSTVNSAGYDFICPERVEIPPYKLGDDPFMVKTGIKVKMQDDEFLMLVNRSSNPKKKKLVIPNSVGIVDSDYYGNPDNDGEMMFGFYNLSNETIVIEKGDKLGQGIFMKYGITDDDSASGERKGGFGSTGK